MNSKIKHTEMNFMAEALYGALRLMILAVNENAKLVDRKFFDPVSWASDRRTVRFGLARRMGHTTFSFRLAEEFEGKVMVVCPNKETRRIFGEHSLVKSGKVVVHDTDTERYRGISGLSLVIIEGSSHLTKKKLDEIRSMITVGPQDPLYVLLP